MDNVQVVTGQLDITQVDTNAEAIDLEATVGLVVILIRYQMFFLD